MVARTLITTADERTWPKDKKQPVLFLGEWCRCYSRKEIWQKLDAEVAPYHWDDREKLYQDYLYLQDLFERLLEELTTSFNAYHKSDYDLRYWKIILGPWLMMLLPILFDRWESIKLAISSYSIEDTCVIDNNASSIVPMSMEHFVSLIKTDEWNHIIYTQVFDFIKFNKVTKRLSKNNPPSAPGFSKTRVGLRQAIKNIIGPATSLCAQNNDYFFINTYLNGNDVIKLQLKLHQFPGLYWDQSFDNNDSIKHGKRFIVAEFNPQNKFEAFVKEVLSLHTPIVYLEGYNELVRQSKNNLWPKKPKVIWTSNSYFMNDVFKVWVASQVASGSILVIGQHGGHYGQGLFSFTEYFELAVSDFYLSWGWKWNNKKVTPIGRIRKSMGYKKQQSARKSLLLLLSATSRYSGGIASIPIASQWLEYFDNQILFYKDLPEHISDNSIVRLYLHDGEWSQKERWLDYFPNSTIDNGVKSFEERLETTKLYVGGWNTTTYLEALASNVPTVIFWDPKYFEIREEVVGMFEDLKKVGILHVSPISAANHVKSIWNNIDDWWYREDVVKVKNDFVNQFVNSTKTVEDLCVIFKEISKKGNGFVE